MRGLEAPEPYKSDLDKPFSLGFCDLISQVARKRGFTSSSDARTDTESDLRLRLVEKQTAIEKGIRAEAEKQGVDPANPYLVRNYVRRTLHNFLTDRQAKSSEGKVVRNTVKSLSPEGLVNVGRRESSQERAADWLTDVTGGSAASTRDDYGLDGKDALVVASPDNAPPKSKERSEERVLFDTMLQDASSQIATLTGGRKDGFDVRLDLQKALSKLPPDECAVFTCLWMENGDLLHRSRTYAEVQKELNLSQQNVRTLEMKALQRLKPALGPSFFRRRS
jgi:RNA polymerase sigma factor (sigma-70 family)